MGKKDMKTNHDNREALTIAARRLLEHLRQVLALAWRKQNLRPQRARRTEGTSLRPLPNLRDFCG
jgi:deferrochelatase/peroxidase EfeB